MTPEANSFFRYFKIICIGITYLLGNIAHSQTTSKYDSIDISVRNFMAEKKIPGFAACIVKDNTIIGSKSYGQADIQHNVPMSLDGIMNIGSISKTFTATAAMQLWEKGLMDLDADVNEYLDFEIRNPRINPLPYFRF